MKNPRASFTVGDMKEKLAGLPDDTELVFQGELTFYRMKTRGPKLEQIEFNEVFEVIPSEK